MKFCSRCGNKKEKSETPVETDISKPVKFFIILSLIMSIIFMLSFLGGVIFNQNFSFIVISSSSSLVALLFSLYSIIMSVYIFAKKYKEIYSFAIFSIVLNVVTPILLFILGGYPPFGDILALAIFSYFILLIVSLYHLLKIRK